MFSKITYDKRLNSRLTKTDNLIFYLLYFLIPIDLINGYFINIGSHMPISQSYKIIIFFLFTYKIVNKKNLSIIPITFLFYTFFFLTYFILFFGIDFLFDTITHLLKFLFIVFSYIYFSNGIRNKKNEFISKIKSFFLFSYIFVLISLTFAFLGFGFNTYGESDLGNKSYFNGANDLSITVTILFSFFVFSLYYSKTSIILKYFLITILFIIAISISTKVSIISSIYILALVPSYKTKSYLKFKDKIKKYLFYLLFILGIIFFINWFLTSEAFERINFFYDKYDLMFIIFSGRQQYLESNLNLFLKMPFINILFGLGGGVTVELDLFDTLFNYGFFGILIVYGFYFMLLKNSYISKNLFNRPFSRLIFFINILLCTISFISGHVIFSGMAGIFISAINSLVFFENNQNLNYNILNNNKIL